MKSVRLPSIVGAANAVDAPASATAPVHSARASTGPRANERIVRRNRFINLGPLKYSPGRRGKPVLGAADGFPKDGRDARREASCQRSITFSPPEPWGGEIRRIESQRRPVAARQVYNE